MQNIQKAYPPLAQVHASRAADDGALGEVEGDFRENKSKSNKFCKQVK